MKQEAEGQGGEGVRRISARVECEPCRERGRPGVEAERDVAGTPMCRLCFSGGPGSEIRFEKVLRPSQRRGGGRPPVGWPGGVRVVAATAALAPGTALRFEVPPAVPVDRARWGIYRAARLRGVRVAILRRGTELTVWRKGSREETRQRDPSVRSG